MNKEIKEEVKYQNFKISATKGAIKILRVKIKELQKQLKDYEKQKSKIKK